MRTADLDIILVPGAPVSTDHWVARWAQNLKTARLLAPPVPGAGRDSADPPDWTQSLISEAAVGNRPCLVVGHGRGATAIALAAPALAAIPIAGAVLVAPHDLATGTMGGRERVPPPVLPSGPFGFPAMVICARNNPHLAFDDARMLAQAWQAIFVDAGEAGPIDDSSGHGPWPEGLLRLGRFLKRL